MSEIQIPLCQPGDIKVLRIKLTEDQWWALSHKAVATDGKTLEDVVNDAVSTEADRLMGASPEGER